MSKLKMIVLAMAAFAAGLTVQPVLQIAESITAPVGDLQCLPNSNVCVGALIGSTTIPDAYGGIRDVFCGPNGSGEFIFSPGYLTQPCTKSDYAIDLVHESNRVMISVSSGRVTHIHEGPLHVIDF